MNNYTQEITGGIGLLAVRTIWLPGPTIVLAALSRIIYTLLRR